MRLQRFEIQKFSYPEKGDTPFSGPYPSQPRPFGLRRILNPLSGKKLVAPMLFYVRKFCLDQCNAVELFVGRSFHCFEKRFVI